MRRRTVALILLIAALLVPYQRSAHPAGAATDQCFPETGNCVSGLFYQYWLVNGGLAQQGLPLTQEFLERNPTDGKTYTVQYFERARFEYHPEHDPPYDVLLGLLGREQFLAKYPEGHYPLYQSNWSSGLDRWSVFPSWRVVNGMLVNDGSDTGWATSPYRPEKTTDYAVEAEMQLVQHQNCSNDEASFGVAARRTGEASGGYGAGVTCRGSQTTIALGNEFGIITPARPFDPTDGWHTYRLEVRGNLIRFLIDGALVAETHDNTYTSGGLAGLWSYRAQVNVRSFKVFKL
jgi:hypothetical protein